MEEQLQDDMLTPDDRDFVTALASGLEVILAFDEHHPRMTLSEVATRTGMNRAKARLTELPAGPALVSHQSVRTAGCIAS